MKCIDFDKAFSMYAMKYFREHAKEYKNYDAMEAAMPDVYARFLDTPADFLARRPEFVIEHAVKGMLPKTRLGEAVLKNLKVYAGAEHPHAAQNPKEIKLNEIK